MRVTMIGHSTLLIEGANTRLITDPWFGRGHIAYARTHPPACNRHELRDVSGVLVSHAHWDHTDRKYFRALDGSIPVLARVEAILKLKGARNIVRLRPWERHTIGGATITAVPAVHMARTIGFVIEMEGVRAYFAGDTYHRPFMKEISRRFEIDVAMMPVSTFRIPPTMGERGAVAAVRDLQPTVVIPMHLGIQPRSFLLRTSQTAETFERRLRREGLQAEVVHLREGERWEHAPATELRSAGSRSKALHV